MKKIINILIFVLCGITSFCQFTGNQQLSSANYLLTINGGTKATYGLTLGDFIDTTSANANAYMKGVPGLMIRTGDILWKRNATANQWILLDINLYNSSGSLSSDRTVNLLTNDLDFVGSNTELLLDEANSRVLLSSSNSIQLIATGFISMSNPVTSNDTTARKLLVYNTSSNHIEKSNWSNTGATKFSFNDSLRWVSIIAYGADPTGAVSSTTAINNAIATGMTVYVPPGRFKVHLSTTQLATKQTIIGEYGQSIIFTDTTTCDMITAGDSSVVANLSFYGTGQGTLPGGVFTLQNGVRMNGNSALIDNCIFKSINGSGAYAFPASGSKLFNRVSNCYMEDCTIGFFNVLNSEYMNIENTIAYSCVIGFWDRSAGNNKYIDITGHSCTDGFRLTAGGNGDHGTVMGSFNHNTNGINIQSCTTGMIFIGCNIFSNNILIGSVGTANNVIISNSGIANCTITPTTTTNCTVRDNYYGASVVESAASGTLYINNGPPGTNFYYGTVSSSITSAQLLSSMSDETGQGVLVFGTTPTFTTSIIDPLVIGSTSANGTLSLRGNNASGNTAGNTNIAFLVGDAPTTAMSLSNAGNWGLGTAPAAGIRAFIVGTGATAASQALLIRNSSVQNIDQLNDNGSRLFGNQTVATSQSNFYGPVFFSNPAGASIIPSSKIEIAAASGAANTAPAEYNSGPLESTIRAGTYEFNGSHYVSTITLNRLGIGGAIADFTADASNGTTVETDLYTYTTKASTLDTIGAKLTSEYTVSTTDATADKVIRILFGGTEIYTSGTLTASVSTYTFNVSIIRTGASTARSIVSVITSTGGVAATTITETDLTGLTFTNTNILKITGQASGVSGGSGDITAKLGTIFFWPAAKN